MDDSQRKEYWRTNLKLIVSLLTVWAIVSFGFSILLVEQLNRIVVNDFPLGFWFAQNGSIFVFVTLIGIYVLRMDRLDEEYGISERDQRSTGADAADRTGPGGGATSASEGGRS